MRTLKTVNRIQGVIFDWAGTVIDFGCMAPIHAFKQLFEAKGLSLSNAEIRKPMGIMKIDHIRQLLAIPHVQEGYKILNGKLPDEKTIIDFNNIFEKNIFSVLSQHCEEISPSFGTVEILRRNGLKIGSTTGYTTPMMNIVVPIAAKNGYKPDSIVISDTVPASRPFPFMIYQNAINLALNGLHNIVKVGDTIADIEDAKSAPVWAVGVIDGSSLLGLSKQEFANLSKDNLKIARDKARSEFMEAGADFVLENITELPEIIEEINKGLAVGIRPRGYGK